MTMRPGHHRNYTTLTDVTALGICRRDPVGAWMLALAARLIARK